MNTLLVIILRSRLSWHVKRLGVSSSVCSQPTNLDGKRNVIDALPLSFPFVSVANCVITTDNGNGFKNVVIRQCNGAERSNVSDKEITKLIK